MDEAKARNAFRQALHRLRSALGEAIVPQEREILRLTPGDQLAIDVHEFESAVRRGRLDDAIELYRGDFLDGVTLGEPAFDLWTDQERDRLRLQFRVALEQMIAKHQTEGRWSDAIATSRRLLEVAPLEESVARIAATTLLAAGRRAEARDVLVQFGSRLSSELGLSVPAETQALLARIERLADAAAPAASISSSGAPSLVFAGREAEVSRMLALWRATGEDAGTVALIEGEAGIGKSRLVREIVAHARSLRRSLVLLARERPAAAQVPYTLFAEAFRPLVRAAGIVGASRHLLAEASRLLPELRDTLELPALTDIADEAARLRFFEGIAALVDAAAYEQPVLIALDDLQHIGQSSLDLLSYLTARLSGSAVMFVLAFRPADTPVSVATRLRALAGPGSAGGGERSIAMQLGPIDRASALIAIDIADGWPRLSADVVDRVVSAADGNPSRLAEVLARAHAGEDVGRLPVAAHDYQHERLQRLSSSHRRAFLVLGLIGRLVPMKTLGDAAHLSEMAAREAVQELVAERLVDLSDAGVVADPDAATFALEAAGQASRAFLAGWIAEALAADSRTPAAELARLNAQAGRAGEAFAFSRRAAFDAMRLGAWPEAIQQLNVARTFAADASDAADVEGLLTALGAGNLRIPVSQAPPAPGPETVTADPSSGGAATPVALWEQWFPNWRLLLGAAVATLVITTVVMWGTPQRVASRGPFRDTLVVIEGDPPRAFRYVTGDLISGFQVSEAFERSQSGPAWSDSLARPWSHVLAGPRGQSVAATRVELSGSDVYVISADRSDTVLVAHSGAEARAVGWSPDGRWVLVVTTTRGQDGTADADLTAIRVDGGARIALDTAAHRSVVEAAWSPDGSRIAWVSRVGPERQQEIFISLADGSSVENVTRHPADDYHADWSGDGELLGFTSTRDGNAELYAVTMRERRLWRLTRDPAQDDWARFSSSGRLVAFESTRGGSLGVYVMPALGGEPVRIAHPQPVALQDWRGGNPRYVERVYAEVRDWPEAGDTVPIHVAVFDQFGDSLNASTIGVTVADSTTASVWTNSATGVPFLVARRGGLARLVADVGRWRSDTTFVRVGSSPITLSDGVAAFAWRPLGQPRPVFGGAGITLAGDRDWESAVLSRIIAPLTPGFAVSVSLSGFLSAAETPVVGIALVAPEQPATLDSVAPQFFRHASLTWDLDARRTIFAVGREIFSEPTVPATDTVSAELRVDADSTVSFSIGGQPRWRSTLKVVSTRSTPRAQLWIGGRTTGPLRILAARMRLDSLSSR